MILELAQGKTNRPVAATLKDLHETLANYEDSKMPSSQRRFLMRAVQALFPGEEQFPTLAAEDLAALYLEAAPTDVNSSRLVPTSLPGIWQFASAHGRVITLHRTDGLIKRMRAAASSPILPADVRLNLFRPGQESNQALFSLAAGANFPGWRLGLSLADQQIFQTASQGRVTRYLWIGVLVISSAVILGSLALGMVRRQMTLTQLRNDLVANVTHELKTPVSVSVKRLTKMWQTMNA